MPYESGVVWGNLNVSILSHPEKKLLPIELRLPGKTTSPLIFSQLLNA